MGCQVGCGSHACEQKAVCAWVPLVPSCSCRPMMCPITLCTSSFHGSTSVSARTNTCSTPADSRMPDFAHYCLLCCAISYLVPEGQSEDSGGAGPKWKGPHKKQTLSLHQRGAGLRMAIWTRGVRLHEA